MTKVQAELVTIVTLTCLGTREEMRTEPKTLQLISSLAQLQLGQTGVAKVIQVKCMTKVLSLRHVETQSLLEMYKGVQINKTAVRRKWIPFGGSDPY